MELAGLKLGESAAYYSSHSEDFVGDPLKAQVLLFDNLNDPKALAAAHEILSLKLWKGELVSGCVWGAFTTTDLIGVPNQALNVFEVIIEVSPKPQKSWFLKHFDKNIVEGAFQWWEDSGNNAKISPRQLESALKIYIQKGDLRDVLPLTCNIDKLISILNLENLMKKDDKEAAREFLKKEFPSIPFIISKSPTLMNYFLPLLTIEKIESYMSIYDDVFNHIVSRSTNDVVYRNICKNVIQRNNFGVLTKKIRRFLIENKEVSLAFSKDDSQ